MIIYQIVANINGDRRRPLSGQTEKICWSQVGIGLENEASGLLAITAADLTGPLPLTLVTNFTFHLCLPDMRHIHIGNGLGPVPTQSLTHHYVYQTLHEAHK